MRVPLQKWMSEQTIDDDMLWKGAWGKQAIWVRDSLKYLVARGMTQEEYNLKGFELRTEPCMVNVISTHTSKSIVLPVYEFERLDSLTRSDGIDLKLVLRNNFYDWKLSVLSSRPIDADFSGLFHTSPPIAPEYTGNELSPVYFEGFPPELVFGYYETTDKRRWSAAIGSNESLYTTIFLIMRALGQIEPHAWHTETTHRAALADKNKKV